LRGVARNRRRRTARGIVTGIGVALTEATLVDRCDGCIINPSLAEYHVPVHADVPPIDVHCFDDPDPTTPVGVLSPGEVGITGAAAAVANAIHHATGRPSQATIEVEVVAVSVAA
jgi:xanthine dehydrogenase YagR molybdenum-binding subunit